MAASAEDVKTITQETHHIQLERKPHKGCLCARERWWRGEGLWGNLPPQVPSLPGTPFQLLLTLLSFQRVNSDPELVCYYTLISYFSADTNVQYSNSIILTSFWFYFEGDVSSVYFLLFSVYSNFRISLPVNNNYKLKHIFFLNSQKNSSVKKKTKQKKPSPYINHYEPPTALSNGHFGVSRTLHLGIWEVDPQLASHASFRRKRNSWRSP